MNKKDKVDFRNRNKRLSQNLIKWWNVKEVSAEEDAASLTSSADQHSSIEASGLEEDEKELFQLIMEQSDHSKVYSSAMEEIRLEQEAKANEIYARLMAEAAQDEKKKADEIEALKKMNEDA